MKTWYMRPGGYLWQPGRWEGREWQSPGSWPSLLHDEAQAHVRAALANRRRSSVAPLCFVW
jgi:hypothetical protein